MRHDRSPSSGLHRQALRATLLVLALAPAVAPVAGAVVPGNSKIVYSFFQDGTSTLWLVAPDGTGLTRVLPAGSDGDGAAISPDGTRVIYESPRRRYGQLYMANLDGTGEHRVWNTDFYGTSGTWSPDGTRIAFSHSSNVGLPGDTFTTWVVNTNGTGLVQLSPDGVDDLFPDWSHDGAKIAFVSTVAGHHEVFVMNPDGTDRQQITNGSADLIGPKWSPDGTKLVYSFFPTPGSYSRASIHVMNADGTGDTALTDTSSMNAGPVWSPDGSRISFHSDRSGCSQIYTMAGDGTDLQRVTWVTSTPGTRSGDWGIIALDAQIHVAAEAAGHDVRVHWNPSPWPDVIRYDIYRGTVAQQPSPTLAGSTSDTSFTDSGRLGTFYYRVRAADQSIYSNEDTVTACVRTAAFFPGGSGALSPATGDFNDDGITDLAVANGVTAGTVSILLGQGGGNATFATPVTYPAGATPCGLVTGDFDDDCITDLAVANNAASGTFSVLRGQGSGGSGDGTFASPVSYAVGSTPTAITTADVNEDGITDLLVTCRGSGAVYVALGQGTSGIGDGTFATATSYATATQPVAIATGDFEADGITDLAVVSGSSGQVSILRGLGTHGRGNGTFIATVTCYVAMAAGGAIATGDFNEDGAIDLAMTMNTSTNGLAILRGLGDGTFASAVRYAAGATPGAVKIGDFNGDGVVDLVLANRSGSAVSYLQGGSSAGAGTGTFGPPLAIPTGADPSGLAWGDFNDDGLPDLAVTHSTGTDPVAILPEVCESSVADGIRLLIPDGGQSWTMASEQTLSWERDRGVVSVDLELSRDGGARWETLATGLTATHFTWTVTGPPTGSATALVRIHDPAAPSRSDQSSSPFTIATNVDVAGPGNPRCELRLEGAFPSPTRGPLAVAFTLPDEAPATLELIDVAGRRLATRAVGALGPGRHVVPLAGPSARASGVYFIRLCHGGRRLVARAVILN